MFRCRLAETVYLKQPLACPGLCVVPDVGSWSAPTVMAALARVVHNRQCAADPDHNRRENNQ